MLIERNEKTRKELALDAFCRRLEAQAAPGFQAGLRQARATFQLAYRHLQRKVVLVILAAGSADDLNAVAGVWTDEPIPDAEADEILSRVYQNMEREIELAIQAHKESSC